MAGALLDIRNFQDETTWKLQDTLCLKSFVRNNKKAVSFYNSFDQNDVSVEKIRRAVTPEGSPWSLARTSISPLRTPPMRRKLRFVLMIVSWNVLADTYVRPEYYPHTDPALLEPLRRRAALMARLGALTADVLCLQEIEPETFAAAGAKLDAFDAHFVQKRGKPDGCAIFVRRSLGAATFLELAYGDRTGHVALAAVVGGTGIATTHLKWEPPNVRAGERLGRRQLEELLDTWVKPDAPWVVSGDLNADASSIVLEVASIRGLCDAYAGDPDACTCNSNSKRKRIDFILHTVHFSATPASLPAITDVTPLPSAGEPSDHLAIAAALTNRDRTGLGKRSALDRRQMART